MISSKSRPLWIVGVWHDRAAEPVCEESARLHPKLTSLSPLLILFTPPRDGLVAIQIAQAAAESIRAGSIIDLD